MIGVAKLSHRYGHRWVLRDLDVHLPPGTCTAIFGPNGAGKTTLLRILAGMVRPTRGELLHGGEPVSETHEQDYRRRIGYVGHQMLLYPDLSAEENLRFFAGLYQVPSPAARIRKLLDHVDLTLFRRDPVKTYSEGMRRRLALARALLHDPAFLILDEPDAGMDAAGQALMDELVAEWRRRGSTVVMATHDLDVGMARADRHVTLQRGRVVSQGTASADAVSVVADQLMGRGAT